MSRVRAQYWPVIFGTCKYILKITEDTKNTFFNAKLQGQHILVACDATDRLIQHVQQQVQKTQSEY